MKKIFASFVLSYLRFFAKTKLQIIHPKIIGVTGSVGKTSAIFALHTIISPTFKTKTTFKGNSESGIPLEILNIKLKDFSIFSWVKVLLLAPYKFLFDRANYQVLIVEMGVDSSSEPKNMSYLLKILKPDIGIVLNVEPVHTEQFGSLEKIADEKMKLVNTMMKDKAAILNLDNDYIRERMDGVKAKVVGFGENDISVLRITYYLLRDFNTKFEFEYLGKKYILEFENKIFAKEYGVTFAAAILAGLQLGISIEDSIERLQKDYFLPAGRLSVLKGEKNSTIIDSSYNSSPAALMTAINLLKEIRVKGQKIVVLGDMRELGEFAPEAHEKAGELAFHAADTIIFVGPLMKKYAMPKILKIGFPEDKLFWFEKSKGVGEFVKNKLLHDGDLVLVKGSQNTIFLETVVYEMMKEKGRAKELLCRQSPYWGKVRGKFFSKSVDL